MTCCPVKRFGPISIILQRSPVASEMFISKFCFQISENILLSSLSMVWVAARYAYCEDFISDMAESESGTSRHRSLYIASPGAPYTVLSTIIIRIIIIKIKMAACGRQKSFSDHNAHPEYLSSDRALECPRRVACVRVKLADCLERFYLKAFISTKIRTLENPLPD